MPFEDAEQHPATDFGHTTQNEDGSIHRTWFLEDEQASLEIVQHSDGRLVASITAWALE